MAKKNKKHEEHMDETWLIPYADMLTLLLALFIVLFAMSQVDNYKFQELKRALESVFSGGSGVMVSDRGFTEDNVNPAIDPEVPTNFIAEDRQLQQYKEMLDYYFREQGLEAQITNVVTEKGLQITIQDIALFDSGKANLHPGVLEVLSTLAEILAQLQNPIQISGHTDNLPINTREFPSNWELSMHRALNVTKYLLNNQDLKPERFSVVGYGEYRPVSANHTAEGRAVNRRVELLIQRIYTP